MAFKLLISQTTASCACELVRIPVAVAATAAQCALACETTTPYDYCPPVVCACVYMGWCSVHALVVLAQL